MKKILLPLIALIMMLSSCTKENYFIEEVIKETAPLSFTRYYTVQSRQWVLWDDIQDPDNSRFTYFYFDLAVPQLTPWVFDNGIMNCYVTYDGDDYVYPLPFDDFYMNSGGSWMWTEQVTCEFSPGNVRFILKYNDFDVNLREPLNYRFMIRLLW